MKRFDDDPNPCESSKKDIRRYNCHSYAWCIWCKDWFKIDLPHQCIKPKVLIEMMEKK